MEALKNSRERLPTAQCAVSRFPLTGEEGEQTAQWEGRRVNT